MSRVAECLLNRLLRDLVECDAANLLPLFGVGSQVQRQVIRNRLTFAIRVGSKINFVSLRCEFLQLLNHLLLAGRHNQFRNKRPILQLYAEFVLGQIHDVPNRGPYLEPLAQILFDCLRLRRRLDNHQCFARCCCHPETSSLSTQLSNCAQPV